MRPDPAAPPAQRPGNERRAEFRVENYDLAATLASGQAFRWRERDGGWNGVVGGRWVRLRAEPGRILAETAADVSDWEWLRHYLQLDLNLAEILAAFPRDDEALRTAAGACAGLRLLRQEPWECLASFICSSSKQIVQIQQIIALLSRRFGERLAVPAGEEPGWSFPAHGRLAAAPESALRECKLGFRAPYLRGAAQKLAAGEVDLARLSGLSLDQARAQLLKLPGVGMKIADCVLLFGYGFAEAFPVDVWIMKALRRHYFPRRRVKPARLRRFIRTHFGPQAGYAQQYLFHYMRVKKG
ncbi:MAG: DNA glycosylase [Verrucomicrobiota bacterium]|jgi:N-glycosylase/DNA lyase